MNRTASSNAVILNEFSETIQIIVSSLTVTVHGSMVLLESSSPVLINGLEVVWLLVLADEIEVICSPVLADEIEVVCSPVLLVGREVVDSVSFKLVSFTVSLVFNIAELTDFLVVISNVPPRLKDDVDDVFVVGNNDVSGKVVSSNGMDEDSIGVVLSRVVMFAEPE